MLQRGSTGAGGRSEATVCDDPVQKCLRAVSLSGDHAGRTPAFGPPRDREWPRLTAVCTRLRWIEGVLADPRAALPLMALSSTSISSSSSSPMSDAQWRGVPCISMKSAASATVRSSLSLRRSNFANASLPQVRERQIGSGLIGTACKAVVEQRLKLPGTHWRAYWNRSQPATAA